MDEIEILARLRSLHVRLRRLSKQQNEIVEEIWQAQQEIVRMTSELYNDLEFSKLHETDKAHRGFRL